MNSTIDYVAAVQGQRERDMREDRLARIAARIRDCCNPTMVARIARRLRPAATSC
jgi:hypothetical protein